MYCEISCEMRHETLVLIQVDRKRSLLKKEFSMYCEISCEMRHETLVLIQVDRKRSLFTENIEFHSETFALSV